MFNKTSFFNIRSLKDKYKGSSCYLFGDGISIKWFDLSHFIDMTSIPVGALCFHNEVHKLDITYNVLIEPLWFFPFIRYPTANGKIIKNPIQSKYKREIKNNPGITVLTSWSNFPTTFWYNNILYVHKKFTFKEFNDHYLFNNYNCFTGSFRFGISLAIYMGFKTIYLIGFDYTHNPARVKHWYEKGQGVIKHNKYKDYDQDFIKVARKYADIITITLDGKSRHLDYITYKDFTGKDPVYRENMEIVNPEYLKVLSSWPGYTIY
jgi:hypothetical protein